MAVNLCKLFVCGLLFIYSMISCGTSPGKLLMDHQENGETVIRISNPTRFLLLPIEENAAEARVYIDHKETYPVPMNIRLAVNRIDYYVPLQLPENAGPLVITINSVSSQAVCWEKMALSETFDDSNREKFRPLYHFSPAYGWMNDPNGLVYLDGEYHLFYQYNPYGSVWGNMHWGHAVSKDLVRWEHLPVAIAPDELGTVFSGNCIIDKENTAGFGKDAMIAYYTSAGEKQTQSIAYSTDQGRTFTKYDKNPVVTADIPDFRDPNVFYYEPTGKWIMVIAAGQEVQFFSSSDLLHWEYESSFGEGYGNHGGVWECPDLLQLPVNGDPNQKKWVLLLNINPGGIFGGSATQYFTGDFDGRQFTCESAPETEKWMDWGKDHYATITWSNAPQGRAIAIAWMSNWQYANQVPTLQFRSANSVPREISLFTKENETYLINQPVPELKSLRKESHSLQAFTVNKSYNIDQITENNTGSYELEVSFTNGSAGIMGMTLFNSKGESVDLYYDLSEKKFCMDRTKSGLTQFSPDFPAVTYAPVEKQNTYTLRIFVDNCSIECFDGDGKFVMTNLVFPDEPYNRINFYSKGGAFEIGSLDIYTLDTY
ncbi:MAG: GH32 C-terminal domain-containing protein [Tannerellaceae bacterium]|nr:GH32 C-terminal domain-containing protein [Tannerellaceae bacterium]